MMDDAGRRLSMENSSRDSHRRRPGGNVRDDQRIRRDCSTVADGHGANDARVASDGDVVAYSSSACSGPRSNGTYLVDYAVSSDLRIAVHPEANMRNEQARADLGVRMNVGVRHHRKQLGHGPECQTKGHPKPSRLASVNYFLKPIDHQCPKASRFPTAVSVLPEMREIGPKRPPLVIACPSFNCISIVLQWTSCQHKRKSVNASLGVHKDRPRYIHFRPHQNLVRSSNGRN